LIAQAAPLTRCRLSSLLLGVTQIHAVPKRTKAGTREHCWQTKASAGLGQKRLSKPATSLTDDEIETWSLTEGMSQATDI